MSSTTTCRTSGQQRTRPVRPSLKWHYMDASISAPQDRYSFFAAGNFDVTDRVRANARATFAESDTETRLFGTSVVFGWETVIPYNPTTDSPVNPTLNYRDPAVVQAVRDNPAAFANPGFIATGQAGAQHPVPTELAILLNSRSPSTYCQRGSILPTRRARRAPRRRVLSPLDFSRPHGVRRACPAARGARTPRPRRIPPSTGRTEWAPREGDRQLLGNPAGIPRTACRRVAP